MHSVFISYTPVLMLCWHNLINTYCLISPLRGRQKVVLPKRYISLIFNSGHHCIRSNTSISNSSWSWSWSACFNWLNLWQDMCILWLIFRLGILRFLYLLLLSAHLFFCLEMLNSLNSTISALHCRDSSSLRMLGLDFSFNYLCQHDYVILTLYFNSNPT